MWISSGPLILAGLSTLCRKSDMYAQASSQTKLNDWIQRVTLNSTSWVKNDGSKPQMDVWIERQKKWSQVADLHYLRRPARYSISLQTDYCHGAATDETHNGTLGSLPAAKRNIVRLKDTPWIKGCWCYYLQEAPLANLSPYPPSIFPTLHRELGREFNPASHRRRDIILKEKKNKGAGHVSNSNCLRNRTLPAKQDNGQM